MQGYADKDNVVALVFDDGYDAKLFNWWWAHEGRDAFLAVLAERGVHSGGSK